MISHSFCWAIMKKNDQKVGFRDLKCRNGAQNRNLREKLSKTGLVEIFWLWSKSTINDLVKVKSQRLTRVNVARELACEVRGSTWEILAAHGARAREAETSAGACDVVSGHSWLGFAQDCLFCHSMPLLWQLDEQNDEIRELLGLWAWRRWLASDSDY